MAHAWPTHGPRSVCAGERIECFFSAADGGSRWEAGRVVALRYHESRFGEGVTMPYQVRLDAEGNGRLIFIREDNAASIRHQQGGQPAGQAAGQAAAGSSTSRTKLTSGSKLAKARVGRRASTIGLQSGGKLGGKYGAGPQRARQNSFAARNAAERPVDAAGKEDPLAQWRAVTGLV